MTPRTSIHVNETDAKNNPNKLILTKSPFVNSNSKLAPNPLEIATTKCIIFDKLNIGVCLSIVFVVKNTQISIVTNQNIVTDGTPKISSLES